MTPYLYRIGAAYDAEANKALGDNQKATRFTAAKYARLSRLGRYVMRANGNG